MKDGSTHRQRDQGTWEIHALRSCLEGPMGINNHEAGVLEVGWAVVAMKRGNARGAKGPAIDMQKGVLICPACPNGPLRKT